MDFCVRKCLGLKNTIEKFNKIKTEQNNRCRCRETEGLKKKTSQGKLGGDGATDLEITNKTVKKKKLTEAQMKLGFETQHPGERLNELDVCHVGKRLGNLAYDWTRTEVKHRCRDGT